MKTPQVQTSIASLRTVCFVLLNVKKKERVRDVGLISRHEVRQVGCLQ